jgi:hypothetical protein
MPLCMRRLQLWKTGGRSGSPKWTILELFLENLCQACHITATLSANIEACGLCQLPLAFVKAPKSLYLEFESTGDVQAVERADAEFWAIPPAEIGTSKAVSGTEIVCQIRAAQSSAKSQWSRAASAVVICRRNTCCAIACVHSACEAE